METKELILQIAFTLFISKSYKDVTMHDLEKATGLTKGAFYHYFKNKEEIFIEVIDKYFFSSAFNEYSEDDIQCNLIEFVELTLHRLKKSVQKIRETTNIQVHDTFFVSIIFEAKKYYPNFDVKAKDFFEKRLHQWETIIVNAKRKGEIRNDIESFIMAHNFMSIGMAGIRSIMTNDPDYAYSLLKSQFEQLYRLMK